MKQGAFLIREGVFKDPMLLKAQSRVTGFSITTQRWRRGFGHLCILVLYKGECFFLYNNIIGSYFENVPLFPPKFIKMEMYLGSLQTFWKSLSKYRYNESYLQAGVRGWWLYWDGHFLDWPNGGALLGPSELFQSQSNPVECSKKKNSIHSSMKKSHHVPILTFFTSIFTLASYGDLHLLFF